MYLIAIYIVVLNVEKIFDCLYCLFLSFFFSKGILKIQEAETFVAETLVVLTDKLCFHKLPAVGKLGRKSFPLRLNNDDLMNGTIIIALQQQKVGHIFTDIPPLSARLLITVYFKVGECVVTVEIDFQLRFIFSQNR